MNRENAVGTALRAVRAGVLLLANASLMACATYNSSGFVQQLDTDYQSGLYSQAATTIEQKLSFFDKKTNQYSPVTPSPGDVLLHLEAAENWRMTGNAPRSIEHFDAVESLFKKEDEEGVAKKISESIGAALVNDSVRSYEPEPAERILTNFYKAISFWKAGEADNARVEFNRANERARRAVERYQAMIEKEAEKADEEKVSAEDRNKALSGVAEQFPMIEQWEVYDSFVNPAVAYANALFLAQGPSADVDKARTLLVRVRGMVGDHPVLNDDLSKLESHHDLTAGQPTRWIIYESGLSPVLDQKKLSIPWVWNGTVLNIAMALPELSDRQPLVSPSPLIVDGDQIDAAELARMDKVLRTEFKKRWPAMMSRAVISATTKAVIQHQATKEFGAVGNLAGYVMSAATTNADTRIWRAMPERWTVAKLPADRDSVLSIPYGAGLVSETRLPAGQSAVVYVKQPTGNAQPLVEVLSL